MSALRARSSSRVVYTTLLTIMFALLPGLVVSAPASAMPIAGSAPTGLHVVGRQLLDGANRAVILHGINRSGTEYACIQGWGFFDGPSDRASVDAFAAWG